MKSSLRKLRGLTAHHRPDARDTRREVHPRAQLDELAQASQDMHDMRDCYDSLLSAAAATINSAYGRSSKRRKKRKNTRWGKPKGLHLFATPISSLRKLGPGDVDNTTPIVAPPREFSESLRELGTCLLEKTALNDDEESGKVLLMLGKVQFELQRLVDSYRSHITQTITTPSESLLNELRTVEEMKRQCDEKREVYEYMLAAQKEKGRSKSSRESISPQKLQFAQEDYDEEATQFFFRLKSLKQGQSHSLLTQAARHHSAQLSFFRKGTKLLEAVEPPVKLIAEKQHIVYQFSGLEDYDTDGDDNEDGVNDSYGTNDDGELSFDYGQNEQGHDVVSTSRNSMELDQADHTSTTISIMEMTPENLDRSQPDLLSFRKPRPGSQSAPIFPEKKFDPAERIKDMRPSSTKKFHTYVLPTPVDCKGSPILSPGNPVSTSQMDGMGGWPTQLWHSSPLEPNKHARNPRVELPSNAAHSQSILKESNINSDHVRAPPPLAEGLLTPLKERLDHSSPLYTPSNSDPKKIKRQAFSGPLPSKGWSSKPMSSIPSVQHQVVSPMPLHVSTTPPSTSPKVSPNTSPRLMPSPKINELHELPRPPPANLSRPYSLVGHSAPLVSRGQEPFMAGRIPSATSQMASPLPTPPIAMPRSFSIPSSSQRMSLNVVKLMETSHNQGAAGEISSPLQIPIYSTNSQPESTASNSVLQPAKAKGV